jgi:acetyl esterase/lipase
VFLASWIVLPAPNRPLLALAVGAPEVSAWLLAAALVVLGFTFAIDGPAALDGPPEGGHYVRLVAVRLVAVIAAVLAAVPLVRIPSVIRQFDAAMREGLGEDFLRRVPAAYRARMRATPVDPLALFTGIPRGDARVTRGIEFAAPEGVRLTLDVYRPAADGDYPTVIQIYGGAWQRGAPADDVTLARYLASHGFVVLAIDYRHAPRWQWPAQIEDVRSALAWVREHGREHGADPSRMALLGRSAGAQLAMIAAYESGTSAVRAVVSYYGPVDLTEGYRNPPRPDPIDVRAIEESLLGGPPDSRPDSYREASPISYIDSRTVKARAASSTEAGLGSRLPSSLLIYGSRDHVVLPRFGAMLHQRLRAAGAVSVFLEIPWAEHAFDAVPNGPSGQLALYYTERFLSSALANR